MATYKVKTGDTLSTIAKQYGVKVSDISGYKSGNPNLIYPNEVLTIGGMSQQLVQKTQQQGLVKGATAEQVVQMAKPIITTTPSPTVGTSQIDAGKTAIKDLTAMRVSSDINTIRSNWSKFGLNTKLGEWIGSAVQWNAYAKYAKDELERIQKGVSEVAQKTQESLTQVQPPPPSPPPPPPPPPSDGDTGVSNQPTDQYLMPSADDYQNVIQDTMDTIGTTDLATLISKFSSEELTTPELVLSEEDKQAQLDQLKTNTAKALQTLQENMAKRGMTFSGIRGAEEEGLAADTLAKEAGINREFAGKIIAAARQEQTRRETALEAAEQNYNKALASGGYYYNPITDKVEKTLEREKYEYEITEAETTDYPVSYQEWQLAGEQEGTGKTFAEWLAPEAEAEKPRITYQNIGNQVIQILTDDFGNIISMKPLGLAPTASTNLQTAFASHESAITMLDSLSSLANAVNWGTNLNLKTLANLLKKVGGKYLTSEYWSSLTPGTPEYEYFVSKGTFRSMLTRAAGEKGVLTQKDVENIESALPDVWDTKESATKKINNFKKVFDSILIGAVKAFKGDITKLDQDSLGILNYVNSSTGVSSSMSVDDYLENYLKSKK